MQFITSSVIAILAATAIAAPTAYDTPSATINLAREDTGFNGNGVIPLDGVSRNVVDVYTGTGAITDGQVLVSRAMLQSGFANNPVCVFSNTASGGSVSVTVDTGAHSSVKLGNPIAPGFQIVDWTAFTVVCTGSTY